MGDIQKDLDENLVREKDSLDARLIKTRELYAKTMSEIAENKMKQALYNIIVLFIDNRLHHANNCLAIR